MNCYPREYLELWDIKEDVFRSIEEVKQIKHTWKLNGFTVAARIISFSDLGYGTIIKVIGIRDKTNTKTLSEIKTELKTLF